jgi:hypothetical protein
MTTRLPTREDLTALLEAVRAEPEGPDRAAAIEQLEAQLAALDDPDRLVGPDEDLAPEDPGQESAPAPAEAAADTPAKPVGKPF